MLIVPPITFTDAVLTASNIPEDDYDEWSSATSYSIGDNVMLTTSGVHRTYEALTANSNKYPASFTSDWLDLGPTNRWAMIDGKIGTETATTNAWTTHTGNGPQVEITPGEVINAVFLLDVHADSVRVEVIDPTDGTVYDQTFNMIDSAEVYDFYSYCFSEVTRFGSLSITDLPPYGTANIRVSINKNGEAARCGALLMGRKKEIGDLLYGASAGIIDYSTKTTDQFGVTSIVERSYSRRAEFDVVIPSSREEWLLRTLASYRAVPVVYLGSSLRRISLIYGYFRGFNIVSNYLNETDLIIEVEGLAE